MMNNKLRTKSRTGIVVALTLISILTALSPFTSIQAQPPSPPTADYGDAPDGFRTFYPTWYTRGPPVMGRFPTLFNTPNSRVGWPGAHHLDSTQEWLGPLTSAVSAEVDANDPADPDGFPNLVGSDANDDGLPPLPFFLILTSIPPSASLTFTASAASTAPNVPRYVNVLIDWNANGEWRNVPGAAPEWAVMNHQINIPPGTTVTSTVNIQWGLGAQLGPQIFWLRITLSRSPINPATFASVGGWDGSGAFAFGETEDFLFLPGVSHMNQWPLAPGGRWVLPRRPPVGPNLKCREHYTALTHGTTGYVYIDSTWSGPGRIEGLVKGQRGYQPLPFILTAPSGTSLIGVPGGGGPGAGPNTIATIIITSIKHHMLFPESFDIQIKAVWGRGMLATETCHVDITHSWYGPVQMFLELSSIIYDLDLNHGTETSLLSKVENSLNAFVEGKNSSAIDQLRAFINQVEALSGKKLTEDQANTLIDLAEDIIEAIESGDTEPPIPEIIHPMDGEIVGGWVIVEAITTATDVKSCLFQFSEDGIYWKDIWLDDDGSDGWSTEWDTLTVPNGPYLIRATMTDTSGNIGSDEIGVIVDN